MKLRFWKRPPTVQVYEVLLEDEKRTVWYWRAIAKNGRIENASEQGYARRWYAAKKAAEVYPDFDPEYIPLPLGMLDTI